MLLGSGQAATGSFEALQLLGHRDRSLVRVGAVGIREVHRQRVDRAPTATGQPLARRGEFIGREAEPVHPGVHLDVDADRRARRRGFEQADLLRAVHDDGQAEFTRGRDVRGLEQSFEQQYRPRPACRARASSLLEVDQREAIGRGESLRPRVRFRVRMRWP